MIVDTQLSLVHFADEIFFRDHRLNYTPVNESLAEVISCNESRTFLRKIGIKGEIICTPSHSKDSISVILDTGDCIVGDLEPYEYISGYENNLDLIKDWEKVMNYHPKRILYAHTNEKVI